MLFLDCEFDGHNGHLISMALVSDTGGEFYEVCSDLALNPWVKENVLPKLGKCYIPKNDLEARLHDFLRKHVGEPIVADSPADFIYLLGLCHKMTEDNKYRYINLGLDMKFVISDKYDSENPHNALADAKALMEWYKNTFAQTKTEGSLRAI